MNNEAERDIPDYKKDQKALSEVTHFNFLHEAGKTNSVNGVHFTIHFNGEDFQFYAIRGADILQSLGEGTVSTNKSKEVFEKLIDAEHHIIQTNQNLLLQTFSSISQLIDIGDHRMK